MNGKFLGKIEKAEFGTIMDYPFLLGLQFKFKFNECDYISDGGMYTININKDCKWSSEDNKNKAYQKVLNDLKKILEDAKVNHVSQLVNKPIEIEIESNTFKSFRILTEVL